MIEDYQELQQAIEGAGFFADFQPIDEPGDRIVSTTNRNFENRQGVKVRTHLASPVTAAPRSSSA